MKYTIYIALFFLYSCANVVAPTGGDRDLSPPKLIEVRPISMSTEFKGPMILMVFDEQIQFHEKQKLFFSPYINQKPEISISKNKLKIKLNNDLKENTTYELILNEVVKDLNEGNVLNNLTYKFSTGQYIDTLKISGHIMNAADNLPVQNAWVCLYNSDFDSLLYKHYPTYITKSNKSGFYSFFNLPDSSFTIHAIEDLDNNLRFTIPNEKVGFIKGKVSSGSEGIDVHIFDETAIADSIIYELSDSTNNSYGQLIIDSLPKENNLVVELLFQEKLIYRKTATHPTIIDSLPVGKYYMRIIEDVNSNGMWDSGNILSNKHAERVTPYLKEINIRDNWSIVVEWAN